MELKEFQKKVLFGDDTQTKKHALKKDGFIKYINEHLDNSNYHSNECENLYFQSPTGSGKTVMMGHLINAINSDCVILWLSIADGDLHKQSKLKISSITSKPCHLLSEIKSINELENNSVYFLSSNALKMENSILNKDGDNNHSFEKIINKTISNKKRIFLIIDESHKGIETNAGKVLIDKIKPIIKLEISGTQITNKIDEINFIEVSYEDVRDEGLLKKGIYVNQIVSKNDISLVSQKTVSELIKDAINQQQIIINEHSMVDELKNVIPLILIQIDNNKKINGIEHSLDFILKTISDISNIRPDEIAIWLNESKLNINNIPSGKQKILIFKQAIATGWDCPRAQILVKLREFSNSDTFDIQLFGRVLRTNNQKHYNNDVLDYSYIFTDSKEIVPDFKYSKLFNFESLKTELVVENISLKSQYLSNEYYVITSIEAGEISRAINSNNNIYSIIERAKSTPLIVSTIAVGKIIYSDHSSENFVLDDSSNRYKNVDISLHESYCEFLYILKGIFKFSYHAIIKETIENILCDNYKKIYQTDSISHNDLKLIYNSVIDKKQQFINELELIISRTNIKVLKNCDEKNTQFIIPSEEYFNSQTHTLKNVKKYAQNSLFVLNNSSTIENDFEHYLSGLDKVYWWYKNGTTPNKHFSLIRTDAKSNKHNFFPDYIIKLVNGKILVVDTKDGDTLIDSIESNRLNTLYNYGKENKFFGRIITRDKLKKFLINITDNVDIDRVRDKDFKDFESLDSFIEDICKS